ncbi:MAG: formylglycine-generating enzyme family protein [Treponema sp.]|nr:formylglycine-generating enzyme family protein [Treponema sp.]
MKKLHSIYPLIILLILIQLMSCAFEDDFMNDLKNKSVLAGIAHRMIWIPGGTFDMGRNLPSSGGFDQLPITTVTMTGFNISSYELTQEQYNHVMGINPGSNKSSADGNSGNLPVENVSWYDAVAFCNKLSVMANLTPAYRIPAFNSTDPLLWGSVPADNNSIWNKIEIVPGSDGYRLPTEAQWEYAAKGGNNSPGNYTYAGSNNADIVAWYNPNSAGITHEVGKKSSNSLGLFDMSGNVREWCWDWYGPYPGGNVSNPTGYNPADSESIIQRVVRGGSFTDTSSNTRSVYRYDSEPYIRSNNTGFRILRP